MADSRSSSSRTQRSSDHTSNARQAAAVRFSITYGKRLSFTTRTFMRDLQGYLAARDMAYPQEAQDPVNQRQCLAIAKDYNAKQTRTTHATRRPRSRTAA